MKLQNKKLEVIKPYIRFYLQHITGQPIKEADIDLLCYENGSMITKLNVGEGYVLLSETKLIKEDTI